MVSIQIVLSKAWHDSLKILSLNIFLIKLKGFLPDKHITCIPFGIGLIEVHVSCYSEDIFFVNYVIGSLLPLVQRNAVCYFEHNIACIAYRGTCIHDKSRIASKCEFFCNRYWLCIANRINRTVECHLVSSDLLNHLPVAVNISSWDWCGSTNICATYEQENDLEKRKRGSIDCNFIHELQNHCWFSLHV